jgi:hypothetical protein
MRRGQWVLRFARRGARRQVGVGDVKRRWQQIWLDISPMNEEEKTDADVDNVHV